MKHHESGDVAQKKTPYDVFYDYLSLLGESNLKILEVGSSSGSFGAFLKGRGHTVWGVSSNLGPLKQTSAKFDYVFQGLFDEFVQVHPDEKFDVLVLGQLLEQSLDPSVVLAQSYDILRSDGIIVASAANVTHIVIRAMLLEASWQYSDLGIIDHTTLRFFTRKTIQELFYKSNFIVKDIKPLTLPPDMVANMARVGLNESLIAEIDDLVDDDTKLDFRYFLLASKKHTKESRVSFHKKINVLGLVCDVTSSHAEVRLINPLKAWEELGEGEVKFLNLADLDEDSIVWADVVVIQRHIDLHTLRALRLITKQMKKIIYETDDFLLDIPDHLSHHRVGLLSYKEHLEFLLPQIDCITVTTDRLANQFRGYNRPTVVIPNCTINDDLPSVSQIDWQDGKATLIIASTDSLFLDVILPAISVLVQRQDIEVDIVVIGPSGNKFDVHGIKCHHVMHMSYLDFKKFIRTVDNPIGIIPLDESVFSSCKTAVKFFDYTAAGIPVICSNVPPYSDVIENEKHGLLSKNSVDDWIEAILTYVNSIEKRKVMVSRAQGMVLNEFGKNRAVREWDMLLKDLCRNRYQYNPPVFNDSIKKLRFHYFKNNLMSVDSYKAVYRILKYQGCKALIKRFF